MALSLLIKPLASLFTDSEAIHDVAANYISLVAWSWGAYGLVMSVNAAFNGSGRPMPAVVISFARVIVLFQPLALLGRALFGMPGLFGAATVANLIVGLIAFLWLGNYLHSNAASSAE